MITVCLVWWQEDQFASVVDFIKLLLEEIQISPKLRN